ncbi:hypothetical protein RHMOL_Rhmol11G0043400 [Rhododendron molle]|uniref:Uncharacterized protein n=1 Tax=Rhododendron molle TaxID=49168 RepID=A0ACC0LPK5_RHOML|nr:hypothetical protein RHMOL_Rhmol11G0043400 [Rhododendron molle]
MEASSSTAAPKAKPRAYTENSNNTTTQGSSNHIADVNQVQTPQKPRNRSKPHNFVNFEAPLSSVLEKLIKTGHLRPLTPTPLPQNLPPSHNPNVFYVYHQMPGHHTDSCYHLHHVIQDLVGMAPFQPHLLNPTSFPIP